MKTRVKPLQFCPTPANAGTETFLTVGQVAEQLQVAPFTVRRWVWAGKLKACLFGNRKRVSVSALEVFIRDSTWTAELCAERTARPRAGRRKLKVVARPPARPTPDGTPEGESHPAVDPAVR
jgi:excisionase family DNA binding protein